MRRNAPARRVKAICTAMMLLYLAVAGGLLISAALPLADPTLRTARIECGSFGCRVKTSPQQLFWGTEQQSQPLTAQKKAQLYKWLSRPGVKFGMFAGEAIRAGPAIFLFFSLAWAARALGRATGFAETLAWLRRAATASLALVLVQPIADTIGATMISPIEAGVQEIHLAFNGRPFLWGILLAGAVWMSVWALEQARSTEIELGTIV